MRILLDYLPGSGADSVVAVLSKKLNPFAVNTNADVRRFISLTESERNQFGLVHGHLASLVVEYVSSRTARVYLACEPVNRICNFVDSAKLNRADFFHSLATRLPVSRVAGMSAKLQNAITRSLNPDLYDFIATDRNAFLKSVGFLAPTEPAIDRVLSAGEREEIERLNFGDCQLWKWIEARCGKHGVYLRKRTWHPSEVAIVTTHFNPCGFSLPVETYRQWQPTIAHPVQCYESVYRGNRPEIENSVAIPCGPENDVWQKERLINLAISRLPIEVRYVAWIDHDLIFGNPNWLADGVEMLRSGYNALQLFSTVSNIGQTGEVESIGYGSVFAKGSDSSSPGGAWIANRKWLDSIGGIYDRAIVGGGDAIFYSAMTGRRKSFHQRHAEAFNRHIERYYSRIGRAAVGYLPGEVHHIWHGDRDNRQYISRDETMTGFGYDPEVHIDVDENGLLSWTPDAPPEMRQAVRKYFEDRREDG